MEFVIDQQVNFESKVGIFPNLSDGYSGLTQEFFELNLAETLLEKTLKNYITSTVYPAHFPDYRLEDFSTFLMMPFFFGIFHFIEFRSHSS